MDNIFCDMFGDIFKSYPKNSKLEIKLRQKEFTDNLDKMWEIYLKNPAQIIEYNKQIQILKESGCKVLRNSKGKHKIII